MIREAQILRRSFEYAIAETVAAAYTKAVGACKRAWFANRLTFEVWVELSHLQARAVNNGVVGSTVAGDLWSTLPRLSRTGAFGLREAAGAPAEYVELR